MELAASRGMRIPRSRRWMVRLLLIGGAVLSAAPAAAQWRHLQTLQNERGASVTAIAVDLQSGETLQALNPDRRLTPASLTKLVLAASALDTWEVDKTFATRALAVGQAVDNVLDGDLVIYSEGDATFDHRSLWYLAAQVKQAGIHRVEGDIVINASAFGPLGCETKDRCDAMRRSHTAYDAPLAAFGVDYGTWCVDVVPALPDAPARIRSCAAVDVPIPLDGAIRTRGAGRGTGMWLDRVTLDGGELLAMGGDLPVGRDQRLYRSMSDPALGAGLLLREVLQEIGVTATGDVVVDYAAVPRGARVVGQTDSLPLREQIARLLRYSNNYISDVLTLSIAAERTPEPVSSLAGASRPLVELVERAREQAGYPNDTAPVLLSGSGLTPENRLSARDLAAVLAYEYRNARNFPVFYGGLVVPADAPNPKLRRGSEDWLDRVALKTGTLTEPHSVFGTAGYLRKRDGGWIAFATLANGAERKGIPSVVTLQAIREDIADLLSSY